MARGTDACIGTQHFKATRPGGVILFDDYGHSSCPGAELAVDEFFAHTHEQPVHVPTGRAFVVKR